MIVQCVQGVCHHGFVLSLGLQCMRFDGQTIVTYIAKLDHATNRFQC